MKDLRLTIQINKPVHEVFSFTLNPANTPLWVSSIVKEEVNEQKTRLETVYRNVNQGGEWSEYEITEYKENELFTMSKKNGNYHVRYIFKPINENTTQLEYYEWVDEGDLEDPFTMDILEKLKNLLES